MENKLERIYWIVGIIILIVAGGCFLWLTFGKTSDEEYDERYLDNLERVNDLRERELELLEGLGKRVKEAIDKPAEAQPEKTV